MGHGFEMEFRRFRWWFSGVKNVAARGICSGEFGGELELVEFGRTAPFLSRV